ncbi:unnamed protein product [Protopolystoma xenopodis]|uniref:Fibronectin type-III domain-containing protein n=1 Tax=Protopolystoma xenopodis TaxID=117903 RepID=A0A448WZN6_9PLAT|nr:unnamed protein product [Protopolystoma xenopodis]
MVQSRGSDGRYGKPSTVFPLPAEFPSENAEHSVRELQCTVLNTSVKITWQKPVITDKLDAYNVRPSITL